MKLRLGLCAFVVTLAACSSQDPSVMSIDAQAQGRGAVAASPFTVNARDPDTSIASVPDRGALIAYAKDASAVRQQGAYTLHRVALSEEHALRALVTGQLNVPMPDGTEVRLKHERHVEDADGNWTWIGRLLDGDQLQEAIITFGEKAVFGSIPQGNGLPPLRIHTHQGSVWAVTTDATRVPDILSGTIDTLVPPPIAASYTPASAGVVQSALPSMVTASATTTLDLAIGYTNGFAAALGGDSQAATRLSFLVQVGNQSFSNSGINGILRVVRTVKVDYADNTDNTKALQELTGHSGTGQIAVPAALVPLRTARDEFGADLVVLVRDFHTPENEGCGTAWLNGANQSNFTTSSAPFGYAVVSDGVDQGTDGKNYFCSDETMVHELGHLMGSAHDRENSTNSSGTTRFGRYAYSFGMKTGAGVGDFYTIMAYGNTGQNFYRTFSNPSVLRCGPNNNLACGIVDDTDNARSLNQTILVAANFRNTVVPLPGAANEAPVSQDRFGIDADGRADLLWRNVSTSSVAYWLMAGTTVSTTRTVSPAAGSAYFQVGRGDTNADGLMDVVWSSGARDIWVWRGGGGTFQTDLVGHYPLGWTPIAVADINGDGRSDIVFRNAGQGTVAVWLMNGSVATSTYTVDARAPSDYFLAATGDFNGDGRADLVWTSPRLDLWMWQSTGTQFTTTLVANYPTQWRPVGSLDVDGNGRSDLLWRNAGTGQVAYWLMNGSTVVTTRNASGIVPSTYRIAGIGDYDGDGKADIVWTSAARDLWMWRGNGVDFADSLFASYPAGWQPAPGGP